MSDLTHSISDQVLTDYDRLRDDCGLVHLPDHGQIELTGDDRKGWLQGQVTQNIRRLDPGNSSAFCICTATGQLVSVLDAWSLPDRIVMTLPSSTLGAVLARMKQMVVMEDVESADGSVERSLLSVQGPSASRRLTEIFPLPSLDAGIVECDGGTAYLLRADRTGMGGWDIWLPKASTETLSVLQEAFPTIAPEAFDIARLEAGVPRFGTDMNDRTLPPEMGPAFENRHVSYNKGCYVGQEVLMRIHSRGHTNRSWMGLIAAGPLEPGAAVAHGARPDAGIVTSAAFSPDFGHIGAAMLRNEAAQHGDTVRVLTTQGEVEAEVRTMPILRLE